ncbi:MAG: NAD(P)H-dependent oxidoreductase [Anaerolineae bacterium]|nr:NAD(P)H-dependent oxidoreductase [Anaerolineae bacterium]
MTDSIRLLGFSGSARRSSHNMGLLYTAQELLPDGMTLSLYDLTGIPFYDADLDTAGQPEPVQKFKAAIAEYDGLLIATPEYNYSLPGMLKNAIDWASRPVATSPLVGKPLAMMGAGGVYGTVRAQLHLRQVAQSAGMLALGQPQVMIQRSWEKFDAEGRLTDEASRAAVRALLEAYREWILMLRRGRG